MNRLNPWKASLGAAMILTGVLALGLQARAAESEKKINVQVQKLSDLRDGETRSFGEGEHAVEATRRGDEVTIHLKGNDKHEARDLTCNLKTDTCTITTIAGDEARTMVMVNRASGDDAHKEVRVQKIVIGGPDGGLPGNHMVWVDDGGGEPLTETVEGGNAFTVTRVFAGDKTLLRCPEGDTTMEVGKDEAATAFRCPKHNLELKKVEAGHRIMKVITTDDKTEVRSN